MAYNFLACDRDQVFLLPPDVRDWLPADHLAWFVFDVVDQLELGAFLAAYRADGHGHPAYDPRILLGVLLYAYCTGIRSSRQIERRCTEDIAFRVLAGNVVPDHVTIARFRARHEAALAGFLVQSLRLCAAVGLVRLGLVALDGTKVAANAADKANRTLDKLQAEVAQILAEAAEADQAEDRQHGPTRAGELPAELANSSGRLAGCARPRPASRPRPPSGSAATTSAWPSWPPPPGHGATSPARTSSPDRATRPPTLTPPPTSPTPTAASCAVAPEPCRATTPRLW